MKFLNVIITLFLHCCCLSCEMKSQHSLMSWNFILGLKPQYKQPLWCSFLQKWLIIFKKGSILDVWLGPECASVVCMIISLCKVSYTTLFVTFSSFHWWFKASSFSTFTTFHKTHTPALQLVAQSVSGRNKCMCCSSHALCYWRVRSCTIHNYFASYDRDVILTCRANKADCVNFPFLREKRIQCFSVSAKPHHF